MANKSINEITL